MPDRIQIGQQQKKYTETNPNNIIPAKKGALFARVGHDFYLFSSNKWNKLTYRTVILPRPNANDLINYEREYEVWGKEKDGLPDKDSVFSDKLGWVFYGYKKPFSDEVVTKIFDWFFPVPTSSNDSVGAENDKSYDDDFYYLKTGSYWYRTPISVFDEPGTYGPEQIDLYNNPPFIDPPRFLPIPPNSSYSGGRVGEQTHDADFYYTKPSVWKRCPLVIFDNVTMTRF